MRTELATLLNNYQEAHRSLFYLQSFDLSAVAQIIERMQQLSSGNTFKVKVFNPAFGAFELKNPLIYPATASANNAAPDLLHFLQESHEQELNFAYTRAEGIAADEVKLSDPEQVLVLVLQDCHDLLQPQHPQSGAISACLKGIADSSRFIDHYQVIVLMVSPVMVLPPAIEEYITLLDMPIPEYHEISKIIDNYAKAMGITIDEETSQVLSRSFKGLNAYQIRQILNLAYHNGGEISLHDQVLILQEKAQVIRKSGFLELMNFSETMDDIGGLENLKEWLNVKEKIYKNFDKAIRFGVDAHKGILIFGMPGCGKSLCAKATANKFGLPLTRLDVGRLLGKYVGESEQNMRKALALAEAISPCVLWIDELEKAFAGVGSGGSHEVTTRLFGQFLTWMQEKESSVFIVATANNIKMLPPEFMRKGRFDEIFFVDLPNANERQQIIKIHLKKRKKWNFKINTNELVEKTEGYSGADLETVVKTAIEAAFVRSLQAPDGNDELTSQDLLDAQKSIKSISQSMSKQIEELKDSCKDYDIRSASKSK